jgi:hypothetical protein
MTQKREANIIFREEKSIVNAIDKESFKLGNCRSVFIREAIREKLKLQAENECTPTIDSGVKP